MTASQRVLCLSADREFAARISAPLEYSFPDVTVYTVTDPADGVDVLDDEALDAVVTDYETLDASPLLLGRLQALPDEVQVLVLTGYETEDGPFTAVAELVAHVADDATDADAAAVPEWLAAELAGTGTGPTDAAAPTLESVVGDVKRSLADARQPADVEAAVCERLVGHDSIGLVWIGEYDRGEEQVVPWGTAAGGDDSWSPSTTYPAAEEANGVVARALHSGEAVVSDLEDAGGAPVAAADAARARGCTAAYVAPLETADSLHGVLAVYARLPDGVTTSQRAALDDVAGTTAYVLEGIDVRAQMDQQERVLRRYERLVETVGDGMYVLDEDGHFMTVNEALCSMTGYSREGLLGEHLRRVVTEEGLSTWQAAVEAVQSSSGTARTVELTVRRKDGSTVPCENRIAHLPPGDGDSMAGTVGVLRDVTERVERERELRRQNERLDSFASLVSHDLRNPLSVAQGYLEAVRENPADEQAVAEVARSLDRMDELIEQVLALAREGGAVTDPGAVLLSDIARRAWSNVETPRARLEVDSDGRILADSARLLRVLENLYRNAIEHGRPDDPTTGQSVLTVRVGVQRDPDGEPTGFYVEDDGVGIPEELRSEVFDSQVTTAEDGNGLGLYVVDEIADAHGWRVSVTENADGGARFEFAGVDPA